MHNPRTAVSVIIPTYNGVKLLQKHLPAVLSAVQTGDELLIIDDAGTDSTPEWLQEKFNLQPASQTENYTVLRGLAVLQSGHATITYIQNARNLRFAASCNRAVDLAQHTLIFLLNNDVSPQPQTIDILVADIEKNRRSPVFAIGCFEYEDEEQTIISGKNKLWFERGLFMHSRADTFESGETAWVSGGSGLFVKEKWLELGGFDIQFYPAYWEDVDLSFRAKKRGWLVLFNQDARVFHQHESTNAREFATDMVKLSWRHADYFTRKHANVLQLVTYICWRPFWWWQRAKSVRMT